jgi:hypothetical protein
MAVKLLSPADKGARVLDSYSRGVIRNGKICNGNWWGYATVLKGASYASLDILIPAQQRGLIDTKSMIIDANSRIIAVGICPRGVLTLGAATGKLKFAPTLASATAALYVETAAAVAGSLAVATAVETINGPVGTTVGGTDVTYKLFATDGGVGAAAVASTMTATVDTIIDIEISFWVSAPFPTRLEVGKAAPAVL